ncbi:MAG: alpha/beta hydrolase [Acidimicrobiia bacterium]|nr:alpha/beta hydrolase [Acidimicrobiia bacterium]
MTATADTIATARGIDVEVRRFGSGEGPDVVWFHGLVGLAEQEPALAALGAQATVHAPLWPGYGEIENEGSIEDMLDFALLGWDIVDGLGLERPHLVGHSFGAMIAAEMACVARNDLDRLVLVAPFGLWLDDHPIPDPFAVVPFELAELLFADPANAAKLVAEGQDLSSDEGLAQFMVQNARRLGTAGKVMFPIPNRRLSKRLYRLTAPTLVVAAGDDALITEPYIDAWQRSIAHASVDTVADAGHLANLEQPDALAAAIASFLFAPGPA